MLVKQLPLDEYLQRSILRECGEQEGQIIINKINNDEAFIFDVETNIAVLEFHKKTKSIKVLTGFWTENIRLAVETMKQWTVSMNYNTVYVFACNKALARVYNAMGVMEYEATSKGTLHKWSVDNG